MSKYIKDLAERVFWTGAEAALGILGVETFDWAKGYAIVIALGVALLKGIVAKHVGDPDSASTVKGV